jgi:putative peptidoglycan lipid II flippase
MATLIWFAMGWLHPWLSNGHFAVRAGTIAGLIVVAMAVYFALAFATGGAQLSMVRRNLKRGGAKHTPSKDEKA